jgi:hypothetical protein
MARRERRMGSDAKALQGPRDTKSSGTAKMLPERNTASESAEPAATVCPTESEIAAVAFELWINSGCPGGSDQEDWLRAEAILKDAYAAKSEALSGCPSVPRRHTRTESKMVVEFRWEGHWEVWESEWGGPRWVWDQATPGVEGRIGQAERTRSGS